MTKRLILTCAALAVLVTVPSIGQPPEHRESVADTLTRIHRLDVPSTATEIRGRLDLLPAIRPAEPHEAWLLLPEIWRQAADIEVRNGYTFVWRLGYVHHPPPLQSIEKGRTAVQSVLPRMSHAEAAILYRHIARQRATERRFWESMLPKVVASAASVRPTFGDGPGDDPGDGPGPGEPDWDEIGGLTWDEWYNVCTSEMDLSWEGAFGWTRLEWLGDHSDHLNDLLYDPSWMNFPESWRNRINECQEEMHWAGITNVIAGMACDEQGEGSVECQAKKAVYLAAATRFHRCLDPRDGDN